MEGNWIVGCSIAGMAVAGVWNYAITDRSLDSQSQSSIYLDVAAEVELENRAKQIEIANSRFKSGLCLSTPDRLINGGVVREGQISQGDCLVNRWGETAQITLNKLTGELRITGVAKTPNIPRKEEPEQ